MGKPLSRKTRHALIAKPYKPEHQQVNEKMCSTSRWHGSSGRKLIEHMTEEFLYVVILFIGKSKSLF
jgi:hypothetical protein